MFYWMDFYADDKRHDHPLVVGEDALVRNCLISNDGSRINSHLQVGLVITIRVSALTDDTISN